MLGGISDNMVSLVKTGKCGVISTIDTTKILYYIAKLISDSMALQDNNTIYWQVLKPGELTAKYVYLRIIQADITCY